MDMGTPLFSIPEDPLSDGLSHTYNNLEKPVYNPDEIYKSWFNVNVKWPMSYLDCESIDDTSITSENDTDSNANFAFLTSSTEFLRDLGEFGNVHIQDDMIAHIESLVALFVTLQGCRDYKSIVAAILLYARTHFNKSITITLMRYVREIGRAHV